MDRTDAAELLKWQHQVLDEVCGQMPNPEKENLFREYYQRKWAGKN
jgi:hypothetical protein